MKRPSFKQFLMEYYKYFNSFSDVVSKEDDDDSEQEDKQTHHSFRKGKDLKKKERQCADLEKGDGEEDYDPCKFRQWMQISNAGDQ